MFIMLNCDQSYINKFQNSFAVTKKTAVFFSFSHTKFSLSLTRISDILKVAGV